MAQLIYADYAASTPTDPSVIARMSAVATDNFGNPSSVHSFGQEAETLLNQSRQTVADFLNADAGEITFTASGTESNNLAILGVARANKNRGNHIITSAIEHPSVLNACRALEKDGYSVTYLPVGPDALVDPRILEKALTKQTILVSIHLANSELGVIQDIPALASVARQHQVYFHTDACQATAYLPLDVTTLDVDLLSFNGTKVYGPKGSAALFVKKGVVIFPVLYGGGQEQSLRSGSENLPGIVGLALAVELAAQQRNQDYKKVEQLRDQLQSDLLKIPGININAIDSPRLPNHLSIVVDNSKTTNLVETLNNIGIAVSAGSACSARGLVESHVLTAIGRSPEAINKTLRISLGRQSTVNDIKAIAISLQKITSI